ncbi:integral membrane protein [Stagonosporopsis vannaccii]|nr:integral membrane protein [Stagonosporopsis vannaccii]
MAEQNANTTHRDGYSKSLEFTLSVCLCYTLCILALRLYIRWRHFAVDDLIVLLSSVSFPTVCVVVALAFVFSGCSYASKAADLAWPMPSLIAQQEHFDRLNTLILVANLSWVTALCLSKLAVVSMLLSITLTPGHQKLQYLVGALIAIQCVSSIILITARCTAFDGFAWDIRRNDATCPHQELRWRVITGLDVATEVLILALPVQLVWNLHMSVRNKFVVTAAFWLRVPTIALTILRDGATNRLNSSADVSLTAAMVVIWQAIELAYSIAAATIAALKRFSESLNTGFGHGELIRVHGQSQNYKLSDRSTSTKDSNASKPSANIAADITQGQDLQVAGTERLSSQLQLRSDGIHNEAQVYSSSQHSGGGPSVDAQLEERVIRQYLRYSVHYDEEPLMPGRSDR